MLLLIVGIVFELLFDSMFVFVCLLIMMIDLSVLVVSGSIGCVLFGVVVFFSSIVVCCVIVSVLVLLVVLLIVLFGFGGVFIMLMWISVCSLCCIMLFSCVIDMLLVCSVVCSFELKYELSGVLLLLVVFGCFLLSLVCMVVIVECVVF